MTRTDDELEAGEGKPLPQREMMSLISTDPADPMYSTILPADASTADGPMTAETPPLATLPVEGPDADADGLDAEPRSETISQHDEASAG
jgi:hypothetical protein